MRLQGVDIPEEAIAAFCARHHVQSLAFFGSILTDRFTDESDIDVLVEFTPGQDPSLFAFAGMQVELTGLLGRQVHLHTPPMLPPRRRNAIQSEAVVQYAA